MSESTSLVNFFCLRVGRSEWTWAADSKQDYRHDIPCKPIAPHLCLIVSALNLNILAFYSTLSTIFRPSAWMKHGLRRQDSVNLFLCQQIVLKNQFIDRFPRFQCLLRNGR